MTHGLSLLPKKAKDIASAHCASESKSELLGKFSGYYVYRATDRLSSCFPVSKITGHSLKQQKQHFWFTNEYPEAFGEQVSLAKTITSIGKLPQSSERKVSVVTGESGLLSCIPELSRISKLIIQIDRDPVLLIFIEELLKNLSGAISVNKDEYHELIKLSLEHLKKSGISTDESRILASAEKYKNAMGKLHFFSSQERLDEFKLALSQCPVQAVQADYFSKKDMDCLFKILEEEGLEVSFFNISNVCEYYHEFYKMNPFNGLIQGMESTAFIRAIPLARDALCAYSSLLSNSAHTGTCTKSVLFERLYQINKSAALYYIAIHASKSKSYTSDLIAACVELAKIDWIEVDEAIVLLRLILAHITKDECVILSDRLKDMGCSLAENTNYDIESRRKFMEIIKTAVS